MLACMVLPLCLLILTACGGNKQEGQPSETDTQAHVHAFNTWTNLKEATCTTKGIQQSVCSCGAKATKEIAATGHEAGEWVETSKPTCTEKGTLSQSCTKCLKVLKINKTPSIGHTEGDWVVKKEPTCEQTGSKHLLCATCGESLESKTLKKLGHTEGEAVEENRVEPTDLEQGSYDSVVYCTVCGDKVKSETITIPAKYDDEYQSACSLIEEGKIEQAYSMLLEIGEYAPAKQALSHFVYAPQTVVNAWYFEDDYGSFSTHYSYDSKGNLLELSCGDEAHGFTYDENGHLVSGIDVVTGTFYKHVYQDGWLYQRICEDFTQTYYYNSQGDIDRIETYYPDDDAPEKCFYSYTYYENGNVETVLIDKAELRTYDEDGALTSVVWFDNYEENTVDAEFTVTYGEYGIESVSAQDIRGTNTFTYSYDENGRLTHMVRETYDDVELTAVYEYEFFDYKLVYCENPYALQVLSNICYTGYDAIAEMLY